MRYALIWCCHAGCILRLLHGRVLFVELLCGTNRKTAPWRLRSGWLLPVGCGTLCFCFVLVGLLLRAVGFALGCGTRCEAVAGACDNVTCGLRGLQLLDIASATRSVQLQGWRQLVFTCG